MSHEETGGIEQDKLLAQDLEEAKKMEAGVRRDQVIALIAIGAMQQNQLKLALEAVSEVGKDDQREALYTQISEFAPGDTQWQKQIEEWRKMHSV